eukprot:g26819.t1
MLKHFYDRKRKLEKQVLVTASQSEESNPDDWDFDVPQNKLNNVEVSKDRVVSYLSQQQRTELKDLLQCYEDLCRNRMRRTNAIVHEVDVGNAVLIKQHPYRLNPLKAVQVQKEVQVMLQEDIIETSQSEWSSLIVLIPKSDGTQRLSELDYRSYRKANAATKSDSYTIPRLEECVENVGQATYITKLDLMLQLLQSTFVRESKR